MQAARSPTTCGASAAVRSRTRGTPSAGATRGPHSVRGIATLGPRLAVGAVPGRHVVLPGCDLHDGHAGGDVGAAEHRCRRRPERRHGPRLGDCSSHRGGVPRGEQRPGLHQRDRAAGSHPVEGASQEQRAGVGVRRRPGAGRPGRAPSQLAQERRVADHDVERRLVRRVVEPVGRPARWASTTAGSTAGAASRSSSRVMATATGSRSVPCRPATTSSGGRPVERRPVVAPRARGTRPRRTPGRARAGCRVAAHGRAPSPPAGSGCSRCRCSAGARPAPRARPRGARRRPDRRQGAAAGCAGSAPRPWAAATVASTTSQPAPASRSPRRGRARCGEAGPRGERRTPVSRIPGSVIVILTIDEECRWPSPPVCSPTATSSRCSPRSCRTAASGARACSRRSRGGSPRGAATGCSPVSAGCSR